MVHQDRASADASRFEPFPFETPQPGACATRFDMLRRRSMIVGDSTKDYGDGGRSRAIGRSQSCDSSARSAPHSPSRDGRPSGRPMVGGGQGWGVARPSPRRGRNKAFEVRCDPPPSSSPTRLRSSHKSSSLRSAAGRPLLREAGKVSPKATDGVWKAGRLDRKFAVTFVQPSGVVAAGHTPSGASRHLPQQAGEGIRAAT